MPLTEQDVLWCAWRVAMARRLRLTSFSDAGGAFISPEASMCRRRMPKASNISWHSYLGYFIVEIVFISFHYYRPLWQKLSSSRHISIISPSHYFHIAIIISYYYFASSVLSFHKYSASPRHESIYVPSEPQYHYFVLRQCWYQHWRRAYNILGNLYYQKRITIMRKAFINIEHVDT